MMKSFPLSDDPNNPSRTVKAVPDDYDQLPIIASGGGIRAAYQPQATKTIDELEETGRCIDAIYPARSTLPQAGRGAFAKRRFLTDEIITGSPLLFAHHDDFVKVYKGDWFDNESPPTREQVGWQLVLNYCWKVSFFYILNTVYAICSEKLALIVLLVLASFSIRTPLCFCARTDTE